MNPPAPPRSLLSRLTSWVRRLLALVAVGALGFVAGGLTLFVIWVRGGPEHELWHEVELGQEFRARSSRAVASLDDYLALEERLFAELGRKVYDRVGVGPGFSFVRYSAGSRSDPRQAPGGVDWNRSFDLLPEGEVRGGALLLHGMSDSPYSMRALAEVLRAAGHRVVGLRLPGHGTVPAALKRTEVEDLVAAVRLAMRGLRDRVGERPLCMVGYSTGAALAIRHVLDALDGSGEPMPESLVFCSPAVGLTPVASFASWVQWLSGLPGLEAAAWTDLVAEFDPYKYGSFPVNAGRVVYELTAANAGRLAAQGGAGFPRTLVFLSAVDATVSTEAVVENLLDHLDPERCELVLFDVNRAESAISLLVADPGPLTRRMVADPDERFALTLVTNRAEDTMEVVAFRRGAEGVQTEELGMSWPPGLLSLSHLALPFRVDDPIYGRQGQGWPGMVRLGMPAVQGERGLLRIPADAMLRPRCNPFFGLVERRVLDWVRGP
jgi:pimeloyl-ACP methyl ester carboxylesterase